MIHLFLLGYAALAGLAAVLRWRYRTWLALLVLALGAVGIAWAYVRDPHVLARAPAYSDELAASLRERPWPEGPAELARLIASFRALNDARDASRLQPFYRLQIAHGLAGEPVEHFGSVAEALAWVPPASRPGAHASPSVEDMHAEQRALQEMLEVQAPRLSGWPPELARDSPPEDAALEIAPGVWLTPMAQNPHVGAVRFALSAHHRGEGSIKVAYIGVLATPRTGQQASRGARPIFNCHGTLHDIAPGETRYFACMLKVGLGTDHRPLQQVLDRIEDFRADALEVHVHANGSLDAALLKVPDAEPLIAAELQRLAELRASDKLALARRNEVEPYLALCLATGAIFAAGMVLPGLRRRCLSAPLTLALAAAGFAVAMAAGWWTAEHTSGVRGWEAIIAIFSGCGYSAPFIAGLLFGNLIYIRQRAA